MLVKRWIWLLPAFVLLTVVPMMAPVWAVEFTISENGSGSTSEVAVADTTTTTVAQTNDTSVQNDISVEANTGGNEASDNNGETTVVTGDVSVEADVTTQVNSNVAIVDACCEQGNGDTTVTVSGNGSGSTNTAAINTGNTVLVSQVNNATIRTNIQGVAVTGRNTASNNVGDVRIQTGDIEGSVTITTQANGNLATVSGGDHSGSVLLKITGNGTDSVNTISYNNNSDTQVFTTNNSAIDNVLYFDAVTGENVAANNVGDVHIQTGDIAFTTEVKTISNLNETLVENCCEDDVDVPTPPTPPNNPPENPPTPPSNPPTVNPGDGGGKGNGNPSVGGVSDEQDGQVLGAMLPATGTADYLMFIGICIALMMLGSYLRLLSGRSPSKE